MLVYVGLNLRRLDANINEKKKEMNKTDFTRREVEKRETPTNHCIW